MSDKFLDAQHKAGKKLYAAADKLEELSFSFGDTGNDYMRDLLYAMSVDIKDNVDNIRNIDFEMANEKLKDSYRGIGQIFEAMLDGEGNNR